MEAVRGQAQVHCDARIDNEHALAQWPSRERLTAAATFGIGSPLAMTRQVLGNGAI
jgi:hypothetical protein